MSVRAIESRTSCSAPGGKSRAPPKLLAPTSASGASSTAITRARSWPPQRRRRAGRDYPAAGRSCTGGRGSSRLARAKEVTCGEWGWIIAPASGLARYTGRARRHDLRGDSFQPAPGNRAVESDHGELLRRQTAHHTGGGQQHPVVTEPNGNVRVPGVGHHPRLERVPHRYDQCFPFRGKGQLSSSHRQTTTRMCWRTALLIVAGQTGSGIRTGLSRRRAGP